MSELIKKRKPNGSKERHSIDLATKIKIIEEFQKGTKQIILSQMFSIHSSTISKIIKQSNKWLMFYSKGKNDTIKRFRNGKEPLIEEALLDWYLQNSTDNNEINSDLLKLKAIEFAKYFDNESFNPTDGWLARWKRKNKVALRRNVDGDYDDDDNDDENEDHINENQDEIKTEEEIDSSGSTKNNSEFENQSVQELYDNLDKASLAYEINDENYNPDFDEYLMKEEQFDQENVNENQNNIYHKNGVYFEDDNDEEVLENQIVEKVPDSAEVKNFLGKIQLYLLENGETNLKYIHLLNDQLEKIEYRKYFEYKD